MKYTSQNGCFFYYDRDTYSWELCEPTLMFLLGFEAITMYDRAKSDHLLISNKIYNTKTGVVDDMPDFPIYDDALNYLSSLGQIEDNEYYAQYNCYGLKLLMNELTGTGVDRTVPVIFLNDVNRKLVDPNKYPYADKAGKSYYDLQSTLILNVFKYAGYDTLDTEVPYISESTYGRDYSNLSNDNVPPLRDEIVAYNSSLRVSHEEKQAAGQVYKLLDYKAMYLYALGVLYGLRCIGYDGKMIWRFNPEYWYFDKYQNLVKTAWAVFRFHYSHSIYELDTDEHLVNKYKEIQYNKLWNFMNNEDSSDVLLYSNEVHAYCLYVRNIEDSDTLATNRIIVRPIIYLYPTDEDADNGLKGKFVEYLADEQKWSEKAPANELVSSEIEYKGVVAADSDSFIRYIAHNEVKIFKALRYTRNTSTNPIPQYLSPNNDSVIIPEGTDVHLISVDGDSYYVEYSDHESNHRGFISSLYTDDGDSDLIISQGEFTFGTFDIEPSSSASDLKVHLISDTPLRKMPGDNWSYFISTGNFGWTDFDLTYWKRFKKYIKSDYNEYLDGEAAAAVDAEYHSVLSMNEQEFGSLYPSRINDAVSLGDGIVVSYYKCNVTDDSYLYGIFDGLVEEVEDGTLNFNNVSSKFKYILSSIDFENMYVAHIPDDYSKEPYYDIKTLINIYVKTGEEENTASAQLEGDLKATAKTADYSGYKGNSLSIEIVDEGTTYSIYIYDDNSADNPVFSMPDIEDTPENIELFNNNSSNKYITLVGELASCSKTHLTGGRDSTDATLLFDGRQLVMLDAFGYTKDPADVVDSYYYNSESNTRDTYDLRKRNDDMYWSHQFEEKDDIGYGKYRDWVLATSEDLSGVYVATGETVTLYRNVRKLFDNTPYHYQIGNKDINDYICNTNSSYSEEFGEPFILGFIRYQALHDAFGITDHLCPVIEKDQNGDSLIIDGIPYVWQDQVTNKYWNEFEKTWQDDIPVRRNAFMYISEIGSVGKLVRVADDPINKTVIIPVEEDGVVTGEITLTYEEFYADAKRGILRPHTEKVFGTDYIDEGIIDCYYDTKMLEDDEDNHIICVLDPVTGECRVPWTRRADLKNSGYWIVDGTATLYNGEEVTRTAYDDDHKD